MPLGSQALTHGIWKDKPVEHARQTRGVFGDAPVTGPKPLVDLDFNLYGGLYRDACLILKNKRHITDPILAGQTAGGGVFVTFPAVSREQATVNVRTQVKNDDETPRTFVVRTTLLDAQGQAVASAESVPEA